MLDAIDLETTGIPRQELNKTKITEISMVKVSRRHILETRAGELPRVQHKLTMCFNPGRMIHPGAAEASGLNNELLESETLFDKTVFNTINSFIACQEKPVCLVAENGHSFDFPILKNHFVKLNECLDEDVMCADSLHAFYDILRDPCPGSNTPVPCVPQQNNGHTANGEPHEGLHNSLVNNKKELHCSTNNNFTELNDASEAVLKDDDSPLTMQAQNENTPKSSKFKVTPRRMKEIRRKLFYDSDKKPSNSYKLKDIYERVLRRPGIEAHRAENDCIMLTEIATAKAEEFVNWIDNNHCPFSEVKPMALGVPLGS